MTTNSERRAREKAQAKRMDETLYREARVDNRAIDEEARTVELAFASETPVERWYGNEVLSLAPGEVRLERLNNGGALLMDHNTRDQIGVIDNARVDSDRVARAVVRFGTSDRAAEIFRDVVDGIRSLVSVGYRIFAEQIEMGEANAPDTIRVSDWEPLEVSLVAVPADTSVGVGRSEDHDEGIAPVTMPETGDQRGSEMDKKPDTTVVPDGGKNDPGTADAARAEADATKAKRDATDAEIRALGEQFKQPDLAEDYVALGADVERFQEAILARMDNAVPLRVADDVRIEVPERHRTKPEVLRTFHPDARKAEECAYRAGMWARATIFGNVKAAKWVRDNMGQRALAEGVNTKGGVLVPEEMEASVIDLREQYGVARQSCRVIPMASDTLSAPRVTGHVTATWTGENIETTAADPAFDSIELVARKLTSLTKVSNELVEDSVIDLASFLSQDMAWAFVKKEDEAWIDGDGTSTYGGVLGLRVKIIDGTHTAGAIDGASGIDTLPEITAADLDNVRAALPQFAEANPVWLCSKLAKNVSFDALTRAAGGNTMETLGGRPQDTYLGDPIRVSQAMPKGSATDYSNVAMVFYGAFNQACTMGDRRGIRVRTLTERYAEFDQIGVISTERLDIVVHDLGDTTDAGPVVALIGE